MGGKALNRYGVHTERKSTEEFLRIGKEIQDRLAIDMSKETAIIGCYRTKADHGDLDLLIKEVPNSILNWSTYIQLVFKPQAIYNNGGVYSFDYQNFQIDFIPIVESKWEIAKIYFGNDPLGNCVGKTFHKFGLSYGWEGLFYKFRNFNGKNSKNVLLTTDPRKIFEFGGYDYDRYLLGFETLEDIFKFIIAGKYFDAEIFQMENLKSIDRKRNRKRGSYHLFLNYLKDNDINTKYAFNEDKEYYLQFINVFFPESNLLEQLKILKEIDAKNQTIAYKFNGDIVMQWFPNLKGKELGAVMGNFKTHIGINYNEFILNSTIDEIREKFIKTIIK